MVQFVPPSACARTAPEAPSAASSASAYWSRPSLESFDSVTIALRCTAKLPDASCAGWGGPQFTICASVGYAVYRGAGHATAQGSHEGWAWPSLEKTRGRDVC